MISYFIKNLSEKYNLIFTQRYNVKTYKPDPDPQMREWMAPIEAADYIGAMRLIKISDGCGDQS